MTTWIADIDVLVEYPRPDSKWVITEVNVKDSSAQSRAHALEKLGDKVARLCQGEDLWDYAVPLDAKVASISFATLKVKRFPS